MNTLTNILHKIDINIVFNVIGLLAFGAVGVLVLILLGKTEQIRELKNSLNKLMRSFNDLDEQAKLIVRTDLELNKAQEELDKRLSALNALQKTSRLISTTLDINEIFRRLEKALVTELRFERSLILMFDDKKNLSDRIQSGFSKETIQNIISNFARDHALIATLKEGRIVSSFNTPRQKKEKITQFFGVENFILTPLLTQDGIIGFLFVGNQGGASIIVEGDEELISILANQIGQALENAQLFEEVFRSRQDLESKIQERTKELASALEELKKISKAKSDFVSAVSHELRTPLTSIKGYASILMTGKIGELPEQVKERLEKVNKHSDNLVGLINDLLDISRIEAGRVEMKLEKHNIPTLIENIRDLLSPQLKDKNIQLTTQLPAHIPDNLLFDHSQIERVFINLLSNAIKFTPKGGTICIKIESHPDHILCEISDTGIGIKDEDIPRIFAEFYRVDNEINQVVKGTGLGLALAKNIIEAHQGKIWVTSKVNAGTTFHFTLPLREIKNA